MGSSKNSSIQPFIKVINKPITKDIDVPGCINSTCSSYNKENSKDAFCSKCGSKMESFSKSISTKKYELYDILEVYLKEELFIVPSEYMKKDKNSELLVSNIKSPYDLNQFLSEDSADCAKELNMIEHQEKHLKWFHDKFSNHIAKLKEVFGDENVSIHYGIISYTD